MTSSYINLAIFSISFIGLGLVLTRYKLFVGNAIFAMPLLNVASMILVPLYPQGQLHFGEIRAFLMFGYVLLAIPTLKPNKVTLAVYLFLVFLLTLINRSSHPPGTMNALMKFSICLLMLPIAMQYINTLKKLLILNKIMLLCGFTLIAYFLFIQITGIGRHAYKDGDVLVLGGGVYITNILVVVGATIHPDMEFRKFLGKKTGIVIPLVYIASTVFITLLIFRRSSVIALIFGTLVYVFSVTKRFRVLRYLLSLFLVALLIPQNYTDHLLRTYTARGGLESVFERDLGRHNDLDRAITEFRGNDLTHSLIGTELFRGSHYYGTRRSIHNDFAVFLLGSGIIGIILYFNIIRLLLFTKTKYLKDNERERLIRSYMTGTLFAMIAIWFVYSYTSFYYVISAFSIMMLYMGAIFGTLHNPNAFKDIDVSSSHKNPGTYKQKFQSL